MLRTPELEEEDVSIAWSCSVTAIGHRHVRAGRARAQVWCSTVGIASIPIQGGKLQSHSHRRRQKCWQPRAFWRGHFLEAGASVLPGVQAGLGDGSRVESKLHLDSTSAQAFFQRLGPGRAKHFCTRILWGQEAMRRGWYKIGRIATRDSPAVLNTKSLSRGVPSSTYWTL